MIRAITMDTAVTARVVLTGVFHRGWVRANAAGSTPSRPIENSVRAAAVAQATHTMNAAAMPPISTRVPSQGPTYVVAVVFSATGSAPNFAPLLTPNPMVIAYVVSR